MRINLKNKRGEKKERYYTKLLFNSVAVLQFQEALHTFLKINKSRFLTGLKIQRFLTLPLLVLSISKRILVQKNLKSLLKISDLTQTRKLFLIRDRIQVKPVTMVSTHTIVVNKLYYLFSLGSIHCDFVSCFKSKATL